MLFVKKKIIALIVLLMAFSTVVIASAQMVVGVKKGDWIEYTVTTTGTPPDSAHSITAARMEVLDVQGTTIQVNITSTYSNGTQVSSPSTLNLATGQLIDNFIIPAGLTTDSEFNSNMGTMVRMKITGTSQGTCVGATRTVVTATNSNNTYVWDQATGVSVEGTTTEPTYTMHTLATNTNMWTLPSSTESSPDMTLIYVAVIVIVVIVVVAAIAVFAVRSRKKRV